MKVRFRDVQTRDLEWLVVLKPFAGIFAEKHALCFQRRSRGIEEAGLISIGVELTGYEPGPYAGLNRVPLIHDYPSCSYWLSLLGGVLVVFFFRRAAPHYLIEPLQFFLHGLLH